MSDSCASVVADEIKRLEAIILACQRIDLSASFSFAFPSCFAWTHATATTSLAISRFEYSTWLSEPFGLLDLP